MLIIFYSSGPYKENNQAARQVYGICDRLFSKPYSLPQVTVLISKLSCTSWD
ncbi:hypothetical protein ES332_A04G113900v1 [Gossypium tomentosum]|uniref:Uncharacterized protein n=1 Tax=Gossypium tomentosum TaxID=34277 RepID=A0A5D2QY81_GOSTO|nr:hypothetical protein ES332_A04G113900v1 [Gossypium tomentosum]